MIDTIVPGKKAILKWRNIDITNENANKIKKDEYNCLYQNFIFFSILYKNRNLEIVPLRFSFELKESRFIEKSLSKIIDIESFWFRLPLIGSKEPLENFYYKKGCCPESEFQGKCIINLPCNLDSYNTENLCKILKNCFMELQNK